MNEAPPVPQSVSSPAPRPARPILITAACVIGFFGAVASLPVIFSDFARGIGAWYAPYLACSVAAATVSVIGLWHMRRWAVYLYAGVAATNQVVMFSMGIWHFPDLLVPAAFAAVALSQFRKMR